MKGPQVPSTINEKKMSTLMFITVKFSNAMDKEKIVKFSEGQKKVPQKGLWSECTTRDLGRVRQEFNIT